MCQIGLFDEDINGTLMWELVTELGNKICETFITIIDISFETALREIRKVARIMQGTNHQWGDYDSVAYWAIGIIENRAQKNDEINIEAAKIIEHVASNVNRFDIKSESNSLKNNSEIDGHVRAQLTYHEGY